VGTLRIIAGELRGRRIKVPTGVAVRPTADHVREALFNILGERVRGARVLDAYAGSGALGLEAASRGAARVSLVEADRGVLAVLRVTISDLGLGDRVTLHAGRVLDLLRQGSVGGPFDLVLADPPYDADERGPFLELVTPFLAPGGQVVVEREAGAEAGRCRGLVATREARYGRCGLDFYTHEKAPNGAC